MKILKPIILFILLAALAIFIPACLFFGYLQVSEWIKDRQVDTVIVPKAEAYLAENYPGNDFYIEKAYHSWYDSCYHVQVKSQRSADTYFSLHFNDRKDKELSYDSYKSDVLEKWNTTRRLSNKYCTEISSILSDMEGLWFDTTNSYLSRRIEPSLADFVELDQDYDVGILGATWGDLRFRYNTEGRRDLESALALLQEIDSRLSAAGIGYAEIYLEMNLPDTYDAETEFKIYDVTSEDLHDPDPLSRLQELWSIQEAKRQEIRDKYAQNGK